MGRRHINPFTCGGRGARRRHAVVEIQIAMAIRKIRFVAHWIAERIKPIQPIDLCAHSTGSDTIMEEHLLERYILRVSFSQIVFEFMDPVDQFLRVVVLLWDVVDIISICDRIGTKNRERFGPVLLGLDGARLAPG